MPIDSKEEKKTGIKKGITLYKQRSGSYRHTGILLQANTSQFTGVSHNTSAIPDCKDWNCNRFFFIL